MCGERQRERKRPRQRDRGKNGWENQMAILWYLLSWRGQKVRRQLETERRTQRSTSLWFGLLRIFKSTAVSECSNKQMHSHIEHSTYKDTWMRPQELHYLHAHTNRLIQTLNHMQLEKCFSAEDELVKSKLVFRFYQKGMLVIECGNKMTAFIVLVVKYLVQPLC